MTRVLVTGFEPFGRHEVNPSALIAEALDGVVLPVSFARASGVLREAIAERDPELVVCFGLADGEKAIYVERCPRRCRWTRSSPRFGPTGSPPPYRETRADTSATTSSTSSCERSGRAKRAASSTFRNSMFSRSKTRFAPLGRSWRWLRPSRYNPYTKYTDWRLL